MEQSLPLGTASFLWRVLWRHLTTAKYLGENDEKIVLITEFIEDWNI